jgi:hypothetical protein
MHRSPSCGKVRIPADCAHCVLDATSFQPTPAKVLILRKPRLEWGRTNGFLNRLSYVQFVSGAPMFQQLAGPHSDTTCKCANFVLTARSVSNTSMPSRKLSG